MLLIDETRGVSQEADALFKEARQRTRRRRRRIGLAFLIGAAALAYALSGGGGGAGSSRARGHGASLPTGRSAEQTRATAAGFAVLPSIGNFGLLAPGDGWAVNGLSFYLTTDDGARWTTLDVPRLTGGDVVADLYASASIGRNDIFLNYGSGEVLGSCRHPGGAGPIPRPVFFITSVARSTDAGRSWQLSTVPDCGSVSSLSFVNASTGFALTQSEEPPLRAWLLVTHDGGRSWRRAGATPFYGPIMFTTATDGWAVSRPVARTGQSSGGAPSTYQQRVTPPGATSLRPTPGGALYRTTDGGRRWQRVSVCTTAAAPGTFSVCGPPRFFGARDGVVPVTVVDRAGRRARLVVYSTADRGARWTRSAVVLSASVSRAFLVGTSHLGRFAPASPTDWLVAYGGRFYATHDGGRQWSSFRPRPAVAADDVEEIAFASPRDGWVLANGGEFMKTTDGGRVWTPLGRQ